jgi:hypothetical protein
LLTNGLQDGLELCLVNLLAQLAAASQHDQAALDIFCARGLD